MGSYRFAVPCRTPSTRETRSNPALFYEYALVTFARPPLPLRCSLALTFILHQGSIRASVWLVNYAIERNWGRKK